MDLNIMPEGDSKDTGEVMQEIKQVGQTFKRIKQAFSPQEEDYDEEYEAQVHSADLRRKRAYMDERFRNM